MKSKDKEGLETSSEEPKASTEATEASTTDSEEPKASTEGTKTDSKGPEATTEETEISSKELEGDIESIRGGGKREYAKREYAETTPSIDTETTTVGDTFNNTSLSTSNALMDRITNISSSTGARLEEYDLHFYRKLNKDVLEWFRKFEFEFCGYRIYAATEKQDLISTDVATVFYKASCNPKAKEFFLSEAVHSFFKSSYKAVIAHGFKEFTGVISTALEKQEALYTDEGAPLSKPKVLEVVADTLRTFPITIINIIVDDVVGPGDFWSVFQSYPTLTMAGEDATVAYNDSICEMMFAI